MDARIERIKAKISEQEYQRMVSNVDLNSPLRLKEQAFDTCIGIFPECKLMIFKKNILLKHKYFYL